MTTLRCACGASTPPGHVICRSCHGRTVVLLEAVPGTLQELDITISRQASAREGAGGDGVAFDIDASAARTTIVDILEQYAARAVHERPPDPQHRRAVALLVTTPTGQAAYLASLPWLAAAAWAPQFVVQLADAHEEATRTIDRPPDRTFIGWCQGPHPQTPCGAALYAITGTDTARCPRCRSSWPVQASRANLLAAATHEIADATTLGRALGIPASTIRTWRHRGQLEQATRADGAPAYDQHGRPMYAVAAVRRLALGEVIISTPRASKLTP